MNKITNEVVSNLVRRRGGKFLDNYKNSTFKLLVNCKFGHDFYISWNKLQSGRWCPFCSKGISERICRIYFETIFNKRFVTIKPDWLRSDKNYPLELDGYCKDLQIAFEHNGSQHYKKLSNISEEQFNRVVHNDNTKIELCKKHGIKLIIVPELFRLIKLYELKPFIKKACADLNIIIPDNFDDIEINIDTVYSNVKYNMKNNKFILSNAKYSMKDVLDFVKSHDGACLTTQYNPYKMKFKCNNGHIWSTYPSCMMRNNTWCLQCHLQNKISKVSLFSKEKLQDACQKCSSFKQIGNIFGVSMLTARKYCKKYGLRPLKLRKT